MGPAVQACEVENIKNEIIDALGEANLKMHLESENRIVLWTKLTIYSPSMFAKDTCVAKNYWQDYMLVIYTNISLRIIFILQDFS